MSGAQQALAVDPPEDRTRHGHVDWSNLTDCEALTMLAAIINQSADTTSAKADRHATMLGIFVTLRRQLDRGRRFDNEAVGNAVISLAGRGALRLIPGAVFVDVWPVPGGAPW